MGLGLEVVTGFGTALSATVFTGLTAAAGNSFAVRSTPMGSQIYLLDAWADWQSAGTVRIRSPRLHDNVQGIRLDTVVGDVSPLLPLGALQMLLSQDTLVVEGISAAVAGDIETLSFLIWYADLPGVDARLVNWSDIRGRISHIVNVENTLALGTAGGYSGEEALNAEFDLLKRNTDYAVLGYEVDTECATVRWRGADTGNLGVGGPGEPALRERTRRWFIQLAEYTGLPCIPVFNAANVPGVLVDGAQDENGTDVTVTTILAELG